jgi:hypothetical protein
MTSTCIDPAFPAFIKLPGTKTADIRGASSPGTIRAGVQFATLDPGSVPGSGTISFIPVLAHVAAIPKPKTAYYKSD